MLVFTVVIDQGGVQQMTEDNRFTVTAAPKGHEVIITRIFDAPRELVFNACTNPNLIRQWWGQKEFTTTVDEMDVRFGGVWRFAPPGFHAEKLCKLEPGLRCLGLWQPKIRTVPQS
jgi:hypothetical protein